MCFDRDSLPPIPVLSGAAVSHDDLVLEAADGNRLRRVLRDARRAERRRDRDPARRPRALPLLRGAGASLRRARARCARDRLLRPDGRRRASAATTSSTCRTSQQTTPGGVQADVAAAVARLRADGAAGGLHRRLLLRRPPLVALRRGRPRPRRRDRLLRPARSRSRRLAGADRARRRARRADPRADGRRRPGHPGRGRRARSRQRSTRPASSTRSSIYDGAPHSFFDRKFEEFADASDDAWRRVLAFVAQPQRPDALVSAPCPT